VTYRQQYRRCGKQSCSRCAPGQPGHGPYWYAFWREQGRPRSRYIGKELPPGIELTPAASAEASLRVQTLGAFAVYRGETLLTWTSRRALALFTCLLSAPGHRLTREQAIELLWPETDPEPAAVNLRSTVHRLRRILDRSGSPSHLRSEDEQLVLVPSGSDDWLDAAVFERLAIQALAGRNPVLCRQALAHSTGEYLPEQRYDAWTEPARTRLQQLRIDLLLHLAELTSAQGELGEAEGALRQVLGIDPDHEDAAAALMSLLTSSGRGSEALRVYQVLAGRLEADLDVAPAVEVEALRSRIIAQRAPGRALRMPPTPRTSEQTNLPAALTSFVGRDWELTELSELLAQFRLVTLVGPGGCGKTRLALEVAGRLVDRIPGGVWLVELAGLGDGALVPSVVAATLGVEEQPGTPLLETLCAAWREREMLLLLDNCEHLLSACADLVAALLAGCPRFRVLVTSREGLTVPGEVAYRVPSLATPDPQRPAPVEELAAYEAIALFLARAQAHRPDFALTAATAPAVTQTCARLDGLPLAIELAAARMSVLSVEGIAQRLDERFRLLAGGPRTALPRQQTLRATMEWSHSLLAPAEQVLFQRLAAFAGGWTLEAAEAVCGDAQLPAGEILDWLDGLVQKSLVRRAEENEGEGTRYGMLETIREYARERLVEGGAEAALRRGHAGHFATVVEEAGRELAGSGQGPWMRRVQAELDNIRAALHWAGEAGEIERGLRLAAPIWRFWMMSGQSAEGRRWIDGLLALDAGDGVVSPEVRAAALYAAGALAYSQSDLAAAEAFWERCLALRRELGDIRGMAEALNGLGVASQERGSYAQAEHRFAESVRLWREAGDRLSSLAPLGNLANVARYRGDYARAVTLYEQVLEGRREAGHIQPVVLTLDNLAQVWGELGEYERARPLLQEALTLARAHGLMDRVANALVSQGAHALECGDLAEAEARSAECVELCRSTGDSVNEHMARINLAEVALHHGDVERATTLGEDALAAFRQAGHPRGQAFALATLSETARRRGEHDRATALLEECLVLRRELGDALGIVLTLEARARLATSQGKHEEAVQLYGAAATLRTALGTPVPPLWRPEQERDLAALRGALGPEVFATRWEEGRAPATAELPIAGALDQGATER
jgi:predicted ATPase/DNA-binding SARP family transcriptional activator